MAKKDYVIQAETSKISFTSRCAVKIKDTYYTVEATEERNIFPDMEGINMQEEWDALCNAVNTVVDYQCTEILETFKKKK